MHTPGLTKNELQVKMVFHIRNQVCSILHSGRLACICTDFFVTGVVFD